MARRGSYLHSIDSQPFVPSRAPSSNGNFLKPPSIEIEGSAKDSRSGSVSTVSSGSYPDYEEPKRAPSKPSITFSEQYRSSASRNFYLYTTLLGLNEGYFRSKKLKTINTAYCYSVIAVLVAFSKFFHFYFQFVGSVRRFQQVGIREPGLPPLSWGQAIFNPTIVITLCNAIFLFTGAMSSLVLVMTRKKKSHFYGFFSTSLKKFQDSLDQKKEERNTKFLIFLCVMLSLLCTVSSLVYKIESLKLPWVPPLVTNHWYFWPLEFYLSFIAESAITFLTLAFAQACTVLRYSIQNLLKNMVPEGDHEDCPLPEESLRRIRDVQIHHQEILSAKTLLEENFSFVLFYSYGCAIPAICFLGYLILKNISSQEDNWALYLSLGMWIFTTLASLLLMSIPAFMIHEDGEKLLSASFKMYHEALCEERDLLVVSQMTLLVFQIHSAKLTLSASNYFSMNRKILISLFSAIFTYFLILVQFGESTARSHDSLVENITSLVF